MRNDVGLISSHVEWILTSVLVSAPYLTAFLSTYYRSKVQWYGYPNSKETLVR